MSEQSTIKVREKRRLWRILGLCLSTLLLIIVAAVGSLYIPGVLSRIVQWVEPVIEKSAGLRISAENIELKFPLRVAVDGLLIVDSKVSGDTMLAARRAELNVGPAALVSGKLSIDKARIINGLYRSGGIDSLFINAQIDTARLAVDSDLAFSQIAIGAPEISGARIDVIIGTVVTAQDSTAASRLELKLNDVRLRNVLYSMYMGASDDTIYSYIRSGRLAAGEIIAADTMRIGASHIDLVADSALYGSRGAHPLPGLDFSNLLFRDVDVSIDSFQMYGADLTIPISRLQVRDIAGMRLAASGTYAMNEAALFARGFDMVINETSRVHVDAMMGLDSLSPAPLSLDLNARIYTDVVAAAFPAAWPLISPLPSDSPLHLRASLSGNMDKVQIDTLAASMPEVFSVEGDGLAAGFSRPDDLRLDVGIKGQLANSRPFMSLMPQGVNLPPLSVSGKVEARGNDYSAKVMVRTASGLLALDGNLAGKASDYSLSVMADSMPVAAFMPELGVGVVSASVSASGREFNPFSTGAVLDAIVDVDLLEFNNYNIRGVSLGASLNEGNFVAKLNSSSAAAKLGMDLDAVLGENAASWRLAGDVERIDLKALGLSDSIMHMSMQLKSDGYATLNLDSICGSFGAERIALTMGSSAYRIDSLNADVRAGEQTSLSLGGRDMKLTFSGNEPMMTLIDDFSVVAAAASDMISDRNIMVDSLLAEMPEFALDFYAKAASPMQQFVSPSGINFKSIDMKAHKDSVLLADARILSLSDDVNRLDTVTAALTTWNNRLLLDVKVGNSPGTLDALASVGMRGMVSGNTGKFFFRQKNLQGATGYKFGFLTTLTDSVINLQLTPFDPIVAYRNWTVNEDNYITFNPSTYGLRANVDARGGESRIRLLTAETDSAQTENNVRLQVEGIRLQDWLQINPFAPPIAGKASADMNITYSSTRVSGDGTLSLDSLTYGRRTVGDFRLAMGLGTDFGGAIYANLGLDVNGKRTFTALGAVNDTVGSSPLNMFMRVKEFPLDIANPFLPASTAQLAGTLSGRMNVGGNFDAIKLNGVLSFSDAKVNVGMMDAVFSLDSVNIPVEANMVQFNDFAIHGSNQNPLRVSGSVDLRRFEAPRVNLNFAAQNMQFVNSKKRRGVDLYGRGFMNLDASVRGSLNFLDVNAKLAILPETNLTYQMSDATVAVGLQPEEDVVRFVNFADTAQVMLTDTVASTAMQMKLSALLDIRQGSQFTVNLSADGTNRAQIKGQGILDYAMSPIQPEGRLTGRFTIDDGSFRYSLPIISEKLFTFERGSYVAFNGAILNPTLSITATDQVRANVTRAGENSRLVNFDVILKASGTPERLNVDFDLSTADDLSVANELQSMSATQRANQAMNLLLYGVYSGTNAASGPNFSGNALYGFLASQLNTWAAKSIKGVDLSFGLDQYSNTLGGSKTSAMQYSYKVSKSLFNDRFKIVVGGNYSTDDDAEENLAQNLISDISFEYMLNRSGSMYVRLFRKTGFESILEGEVTQTGAGFVIRRKIRRLADIFNFKKAAKQ